MSDTEENKTSQNAAYRRLYRSNTQKVLAGVCGGVAEYFHIDVMVVRILWLVAAVVGGTGILAYIICWLIIPPQDGATTPTNSTGAVGIIVGIILIFIGIGMLFFWTGWGCWSIFAWHGWSAFPFFFLVLIGGLLIGIAITKSRQPTIPPKTTESSAAEETSTTEEKAPPPKPSSVHRSRDHRVIGGICGGLGEYFNIDPTIVRILWVLVGLGSAGGAVLVYVILMFIIPEEP